MTANDPSQRHEMTLGDHLEELRMRLILALAGVLPVLIAALAFGRPLLAFLIEPLRTQLHRASQPSGLLATGPFETFAVYFQISLIATVLICSPWIIYQLWKFVAPGLYANERRFVHILVPLSSVLTITSALFLYFVVLPVILAFLINFGTQLGLNKTPTVEPPAGAVFPQIPVLGGDPPDPKPGDLWVNTDTMQLRTAVPMPNGKTARVGAELVAGAGITQQYRVSEYIKTVLNLALAFGVGFQTPVVVLLLGWARIIERAWLAKYRRYAFAVCAVLGAVLTPADPLSMILLMIPLYLLYELGMFLLVVFPPGKMTPGHESADAGDESPAGTTAETPDAPPADKPAEPDGGTPEANGGSDDGDT